MLSTPEALRPLLALVGVPVPLVGLLPPAPLCSHSELLHGASLNQACKELRGLVPLLANTCVCVSCCMAQAFDDGLTQGTASLWRIATAGHWLLCWRHESLKVSQRHRSK